MLIIIVDKRCYRDCNYNHTSKSMHSHFPTDKIQHKSSIGHALTDRYKTQTLACHLAVALQVLKLNKIRPMDRFNYPLERIE